MPLNATFLSPSSHPFQRVFMGSIIKCVAIYDAPFWRYNAATNQSFVFYPNAVGATEVAFDITQVWRDVCRGYLV